MRRSGCSAKSRKLIEVGSPDELPKMTIVPFASMRAIAGGERSAAGRFEDQREPALAPCRCRRRFRSAPRRCRPRSGPPTTAVTRAPDRAAI